LHSSSNNPPPLKPKQTSSLSSPQKPLKVVALKPTTHARVVQKVSLEDSSPENAQETYYQGEKVNKKVVATNHLVRNQYMAAQAQMKKAPTAKVKSCKNSFEAGPLGAYNSKPVVKRNLKGSFYSNKQSFNSSSSSIGGGANKSSSSRMTSEGDNYSSLKSSEGGEHCGVLKTLLITPGKVDSASFKAIQKEIKALVDKRGTALPPKKP
jgi:hypothetical protein